MRAGREKRGVKIDKRGRYREPGRDGPALLVAINCH